MMTIQDVTKFLKVSRTTLYKLLEEKAFPSYRVGKTLRFKQEDIEKYLQERKE